MDTSGAIADAAGAHSSDDLDVPSPMPGLDLLTASVFISA